MLRKSNLFLSIICFVSIVFTATIELNQQTNVNYETLSDYSLNVQFALGDISINQVQKNNEDFISIYAENSHFLNTPGFPKLPQFNQLIEIPHEATPQIEIINIEEEIYNLDDFNLDGFIIPTQSSVSKSANINDIEFVMNALVYTQNEFINTNPVELNEKGFLRAVRFGNLMINPVEYNPVTNQLKVKKNIEFSVTFENANYETTNSEKARLFSPYFEAIYQSMINYSPLNTRDNMIQEKVGYLIIAHDIFNEYLDDFVAWKTMKGFNVEVAYTSETGSSASAIKSYIENQYNNSFIPPSFVLIVGDVAQVPASYSSGGHVSDLDYCDFTNDNVPDLLHGRFSAQNPSELLAQIEKTIEYERYDMPDPSFLEDVIMISGVDASYAPTYGNGQINYGTTYYFNGSNEINSNTFLYPASGSSASQILNLANQGAAFMNYTAHGYEGGWADPAFDTYDANAMTNSGQYPTMVGNCCLTNAFDTGECFGEALLRKNNGGAIGYIGGSDVTYWNEDYWWGVGNGSISSNPSYNSTGDGAYDGIFHENGENTWAIVNSAIMAVGNLAVVEANGMADYYWEIYHLMGDPSLSTYFGIPTTNTVNYDFFVPVGSDAIEIQANPYSYVGITQNGLLLGSGTVDESGFVVIIFNEPAQPGALDLVVTAQNTQPYFSEILVASPEGPYVTVSNINIDYGTDNTITAGETINLIITVENLGNDSSSLIEVSLSEIIDNPYITIINGSESINNLLNGSTGLMELSFNVSSTAPFGHAFALQLDLESSENDWNTTLNMAVGTLVESFENNSFSDVSWEFSGDETWNIDSNNHYDGDFSARSGNIDHNMTSDIIITMDVVEDGQIIFYKKVSCEDVGYYTGTYYDYLAFYIDGIEQNRWAGEINWSSNNFSISEGEHTFMWRFNKDQAVSSGEDAVWIDNITFPPVSSDATVMLGDLNNDATINILDAVLMISVILDIDSPPNAASDMNMDGITNILDVVLLVNLILAT